MPAASPTTAFEDLYNPKGMLKHPDFRVLEATDRLELDDPSFNIACAYNPAHEIQMVNKPVPKPGPGEVVIHVRATGICGSVVSIHVDFSEFGILMHALTGRTYISGNTAKLARPWW